MTRSVTDRFARLGGRIAHPVATRIGALARANADGNHEARHARRERGQALPLFVLMIFVVTGSVAGKLFPFNV